MTKLKWAYGVTTVPSRRRNYLPRTLISLKEAGFEYPRLFVDGDNDGKSWQWEFGLPITCRDSPVRTSANWVLSLHELYWREPWADRYAIFQDDFVMYRNLRWYLDSCAFPAKGYWNLFTFRDNEVMIQGKPIGWHPATSLVGCNVSYFGRQVQAGRGAVALVFNRDGVQNLLGTKHLVNKATNLDWGWRKIDGGIVEAMNQANFWEYVHQPSLVQHIGDDSTIREGKQSYAMTFMGQEVDAREFIQAGK